MLGMGVGSCGCRIRLFKTKSRLQEPEKGAQVIEQTAVKSGEPLPDLLKYSLGGFFMRAMFLMRVMGMAASRMMGMMAASGMLLTE